MVITQAVAGWTIFKKGMVPGQQIVIGGMPIVFCTYYSVVHAHVMMADSCAVTKRNG